MSNAPFFCFWQELNELLDYGSSVLLFDGQVPLCYLLSLLVNLNLRCILVCIAFTVSINVSVTVNSIIHPINATVDHLQAVR